MRVATHNVKVTLPDPAAMSAVRQCLRYEPDLAGLQEWGRDRAAALKPFATVVRFPRLNKLWRHHPDDGYLAIYPEGGQPWLVDARKYELDTVQRILISSAREGVRPTYGTQIVIEPREGGQSIPALNVHPIAHRYRPENRAAGQEAEERILDWADSWTGYRPYVVGDFNDATFHIPNLISCRKGNGELPTLGDRGIDHIFGPDEWADAITDNTTSDHDLLVADETEEIRKP